MNEEFLRQIIYPIFTAGYAAGRAGKEDPTMAFERYWSDYINKNFKEIKA